MFANYYKSFKSPANIYSIDKYKDGERVCWLICTMKELYVLKGGDTDEVKCTLIHDPNRTSGINFRM